MEYRKDAHRVYSLMVHVISGVKSRQPAFIEDLSELFSRVKRGSESRISKV
ncbi:MAG: hypothetical protein GF311_12970 [Candidatus Lokiarchaeota archaeon]|nr:hypothetical protein [Candidatus Lokiarchaeota archaeon]